MPIDCLDNYIGFRGLCNSTDTPGSGLYINDLPDMNLERFEALATQDTPTALSVWEKVSGRAQDHFGMDVLHTLKAVRQDNGDTGIHVHSVVNNHISGQLKDDGTAVAASVQWKGVWVDVAGSPYMDISFPSLWLYSTGSVTVPFYIVDTTTGQTLYNQSHSVVAGYNEIRINQSFWLRGSDRQFFIFYDASGVNSFETDVIPVESCRNCDWTSWLTLRAGQSAQTLPILKAGIDFTVDHSGGLIVAVNLNYRIDNFICQHRDILAVALRRKAAIEIIHEMFDTDSLINPFTMQDEERLANRLNRHTQAYERELYTAVQGIRPDEDGVCFECIEPAKIVYSVP